MKKTFQTLKGLYSIHRFKKLYKDHRKSFQRYDDMRAQSLLRQAFIASRGKNLDWALAKQKALTPYVQTAVKSALFPALDEHIMQTAISELEHNGYWILPWRLSDEWLALDLGPGD